MSDEPKKGSRDLKRVSISLALIALQRLADPEVRAQLANHGRTLAAGAQQWRAERSGHPWDGAAGTGPDLGPAALADRLGERFGQRRLERRLDRLRSSVLALGEGRPEMVPLLDPVMAALEDVSSAIDVAAMLPFARRLRAHQRVDGVLDALEIGLFEAALPQLPS